MTTPTIIIFISSFNRLNYERLCDRLKLYESQRTTQQAVCCLDLPEPTDDSLNQMVSKIENILTNIRVGGQNAGWSGHFNLVFISSLGHIESMQRASLWVKKAKSLLGRLPQIPKGIQFDFIGLFLLNIQLAEGKEENLSEQQPSYAGHYAWLREVLGERTFDLVFFLTTANYDPVHNPNGFPRLKPEEVEDLALESLVQFVSTDILAHVVKRCGIAQPPVLCSAGAASIIFPINHIIRQHGSKFAAELTKHYIEDEKSSSEEEVSNFLDNNEITYRIICEQLMSVGTPGETVISRLRFDPIIYKAIPMESLPERIASYGDYLARERIRILIQQINENLKNLEEKALSKLNGKVDTLVSNAGEPSIVKSLDFLKRLWNKLKEERNLANSFLSSGRLEELFGKPKKKKDQVELPSEQECHDRLVRALKNRPLWFPVITRYGILGLVVAYGIQFLINFFNKHPFFVNLGIFDNPFLWFYPIWGLFIFAGILTMIQWMKIIQRRRIEYERAILKRLREMVYTHLNGAVHKFYNHLLSYTGDPEPAKAPEGSERKKIQDFATWLQEMKKELGDEKFDFPESLFCIPATNFLDPNMKFFYKDNQNINWEMELRECGTIGFLRPWRKTLEGENIDDARISIKMALHKYGQEGFEYIRNRSLLQRLDAQQQRANNREQSREIWSMLQRRSFFYLPLNNLPHIPVKAVCYMLSDENLLNTLFGVDNNILRLGNNDGFRLGICQVMWGCDLQNAPLIQRWKSDYDKSKDKGSLHKIQDWEKLPEPIPTKPQKEGETDGGDKPEEPIL